MRPFLLSIALLFLLPADISAWHDRDISDKQKLEIAIDYFAGGKYHEALILLVQLDKKYKLNPRFRAYIGVCHYHEWNYREACLYLDAAIPDLDIYAPAERSIYYNTAAESHFELKEYDKAIPLYESLLLVCSNNEKADALYRIGFCHMFLENNSIASEYFRSALAYYRRYPNPGSAPRIRQIERMMKALTSQHGSS